MVVWLNEYFGEVSNDGKPFEGFRVAEEQAHKLLGTVVIRERNPNTYGDDMRRMLAKQLTFDEARLILRDHPMKWNTWSKLLNGGRGGGRTRVALIASASYRFSVAMGANFATAARAALPRFAEGPNFLPYFFARSSPRRSLSPNVPRALL